ncbi:hypothetical protein EXIGLDRAFT_691938 [Exidia glandulosa HHB12029]|uniref:Uncharacterized protein n=1 Tax=Exidia glandulosa HHB12029 TaxID=1314781 RepID=A0A165IBU0_EXIGL|nr:hypothetical protein EXIGLDRAFT_691938 [Exidia glandulosa HHB12029]
MPTNRAQRGTQFPNGSGTSSTTHAQQGALNAHQLPSQRAPVAAGAQTEVQSTHAPTGRNSVGSIHSHFSYSAPMVSDATGHPPDTALCDPPTVVKGSDDLQVEADADMETESLTPLPIPTDAGVLPDGTTVAEAVRSMHGKLHDLIFLASQINSAVLQKSDMSDVYLWADESLGLTIAQLAKGMQMCAPQGPAAKLFGYLGCPEPTLFDDMAANLERIKGLVGAHPAPAPALTPPTPSAPHTAAPSAGKHAAQAANPNSYAGRAAKQAANASAAPRVSAPKPAAPPTNPRARHHPARLILSVHATPELTAHIRSDAKRLRDDVNKSLSGLKTKRTPAAPLRIAGMDTTASGNIVVYAADGLTSEDLLPHADKIAGAIVPSSTDFIKASRDEPWHQVLVNGVPTHVHGVDGLPSDKELLDEIVNYNSHKYEWACMPRWLGRPADVQMRPRSSVILAFLNAADAAHAIQHSVSVFGNFCSARRFEDVPRVRTCDNCCGTDHTGRICEREMRCGVCCSNLHTTASHKCDDISCDFYSQVHAPGAHCEHTKLKCPHCSGAHVVRDAQCKVWQSRRNALRKPQHTAAKTGGRVRRTQSRVALGTKDGRPVSGANALELGKANDAARKAAATSNRSTPPAEPAQVDSA